MYALHNQHRSLVELKRFIVPLASSADEVITWHLDTLAIHQTLEVAVQKLQINGLQSLEVIISLLISWSLFTIDKVVIE